MIDHVQSGISNIDLVENKGCHNMAVCLEGIKE